MFTVFQLFGKENATKRTMTRKSALRVANLKDNQAHLTTKISQSDFSI